MHCMLPSRHKSAPGAHSPRQAGVGAPQAPQARPMLGSDSSMTPLQLSSRPLQVSVAPGRMEAALCAVQPIMGSLPLSQQSLQVLTPSWSRSKMVTPSASSICESQSLSTPSQISVAGTIWAVHTRPSRAALHWYTPWPVQPPWVTVHRVPFSGQGSSTWPLQLLSRSSQISCRLWLMMVLMACWSWF